jgi:hypothetical protein
MDRKVYFNKEMSFDKMKVKKLDDLFQLTQIVWIFVLLLQ